MTNRHWLISLLACALILGVASGLSCSRLRFKASISGTVYLGGRPACYGTVQAFKDGGFVSQTAASDSGHYIIRDLDPGTYTLVYLNAMGAPIGEETTVQVRLGRFEQVDLQLTGGIRQPIR